MASIKSSLASANIDALSKAKIERAARAAGKTLRAYLGEIVEKKMARITG